MYFRKENYTVNTNVPLFDKFFPSSVSGADKM